MSDRSTPWIVPLGDAGLLVRFGTTLSAPANAEAIAFARAVAARGRPTGVTEIVPSLVSVLLRYDPAQTGFAALAGEVRLLAGMMGAPEASDDQSRLHRIGVAFDGEDLPELAERLGLSVAAFVEQHNAGPLNVLATGFAPGFVYCGFHPDALRVERRPAVRALVPAGTVLFAAGQTAIAATPIPTGWHVIGHTPFRNFDPSDAPPTRLAAGDRISFAVLA